MKNLLEIFEDSGYHVVILIELKDPKEATFPSYQIRIASIYWEIQHSEIPALRNAEEIPTLIPSL